MQQNNNASHSQHCDDEWSQWNALHRVVKWQRPVGFLMTWHKSNSLFPTRHRSACRMRGNGGSWCIPQFNWSAPVYWDNCLPGSTNTSWCIRSSGRHHQYTGSISLLLPTSLISDINIRLSFFLLRGGTCTLHIPVLRPASWAGPMHSIRGGTSAVQRNTSLTVCVKCRCCATSLCLVMDSASPLACSLVRAHPRERCV